MGKPEGSSLRSQPGGVSRRVSSGAQPGGSAGGVSLVRTPGGQPGEDPWGSSQGVSMGDKLVIFVSLSALMD